LLKDEIEACRVTSESWTSAPGRLRGAEPFVRRALYLMLQNRIYRGEIVTRNYILANTRRSSIGSSGMRFRPQLAGNADRGAAAAFPGGELVCI
jgi:hypothetical protein